jgi:environmental stress-induced protein Ves
VTDPFVVLRHADHVRMPWANGCGTTYQVLTSPPGAAMDDFDWRISLADVDGGGPFSSLRGIDRILVVVEGAGMGLVVDGRPVTARPLEPLHFPGEAVVSAALASGPTRDLNVMTRRGVCTAALSITRVERSTVVRDTPGATVLAVVLAGTCDAGQPDAPTLEPRDVLLVDRPLELVGAATLAIVRILPRSGRSQRIT